MEDRTLSRIGIISDAVSNLNDKHMNALFGRRYGYSDECYSNEGCGGWTANSAPPDYLGCKTGTGAEPGTNCTYDDTTCPYTAGGPTCERTCISCGCK